MINGLTGLLTSSLLSSLSGGSHPFAKYKRPALYRPTPDYTMLDMNSGDTVAMTNTGFNSTTTGGTIIFDFDMANWEGGGAATQGIIQIGNTTTEFFSFFLTGSVVRAIQNSDGVQRQRADVFQRAHNIGKERSFPSTHHRVAFTCNADGQFYLALDGCIWSFMDSGFILPEITTASNVYFGLLGGGSLINPLTGFTPNKVEFFNTPLTAEQTANATLVTDLFKTNTYNAKSYYTGGIGQSQITAKTAIAAPEGFTSTATNAKKNNKSANYVTFASPAVDGTPALTDLGQTGGWSWQDYVLNTLGNANKSNEFASSICGNGGTGFFHTSGASTGNYNYAAATSGGFVISRWLMSLYMYQLAAYQNGSPLVFLFSGGESDALDASTATSATFKTALDRVYRCLRPVMGNAKVIVAGLHDQPATGFNKWVTINTAMSEWAATNNLAFLSKEGFSTLADDDLHLDGAGQQQLGQPIIAQL